MALFQPNESMDRPIWIDELHTTCVFLLDTSGSMQANNANGKLTEGLRTFKSLAISDKIFDFGEHTKVCIDVAIISFGPDVVLRQNFVPTQR